MKYTTMTMQDLIDLIPETLQFTRFDLIEKAMGLPWYDKYDLKSHALNETMTRVLTKMAKEGFLEFVRGGCPGRPNIYKRTDKKAPGL